jgi:hypothetical protein
VVIRRKNGIAISGTYAGADFFCLNYIYISRSIKITPQSKMLLEEELYHEILKKRRVTLSPMQDEKFRFACKKSIPENPGLGFSGLLLACNIYLNFILDSPDLDLGPIKPE